MDGIYAMASSYMLLAWEDKMSFQHPDRSEKIMWNIVIILLILWLLFIAYEGGRTYRAFYG
jgi:hypothetical protein